MTSDRISVKLTTSSPEWPFIRQTPGRLGIWKECQFRINEAGGEPDWWVVFGDLPETENAVCDASRTILITGEPSTVKPYLPEFTNQFAYVISCQHLSHRRLIQTQSGFPWMVGAKFDPATNQWSSEYSKDYDELKHMPPLAKNRLISVICSDKTITPMHIRRLEFIDAMAKHFGERLDVFGRGLRSIEDKWEALAPYRYHIVLENNVEKHYWTEKLSDAFLAQCYPFYFGCPNIGDYFASATLTPIWLDDPGLAAGLIEREISANRFESTVKVREQAKHLVLNDYNLFAVIRDLVVAEDRKPQIPRTTLTLRPHSFSSRSLKQRGKRAWNRIRRKVGI